VQLCSSLHDFGMKSAGLEDSRNLESRPSERVEAYSSGICSVSLLPGLVPRNLFCPWWSLEISMARGLDIALLGLKVYIVDSGSSGIGFIRESTKSRNFK
jgi:hypothetical protein